MELAVIGKEDFCLGFRLAGVKKVLETDKPGQAIRQLKQDASVGVAIFDENLAAMLDEDEKQELEDSLRPVFISLSTKASEESLKRMIRKSIGVEL